MREAQPVNPLAPHLTNELSPEAEAACYRRAIYRKAGARVGSFENCSGAVGLLFFRFEAPAEMDEVLLNDYEHIRVLVEEH